MWFGQIYHPSREKAQTVSTSYTAWHSLLPLRVSWTPSKMKTKQNRTGRELMFIEHLLQARHCETYFTVNSLPSLFLTVDVSPQPCNLNYAFMIYR